MTEATLATSTRPIQFTDVGRSPLTLNPKQVPIVYVSEGRAYANSMAVAAYFGKLHKNVLQSIDEMISDLPALGLNFQLEGKSVKTGFGTRSIRSYNMDRKGFILLTMGFTGVEALQFKSDYIDAFDRALAEIDHLRAEIAAPKVTLPNFDDAIEAARAWADAREQKLLAEREVKALTVELQGTKEELKEKKERLEWLTLDSYRSIYLKAYASPI